MTVDIIVSPTSTRSYSVPAAVIASVVAAWRRDETAIDDTNRGLVQKLVVDRKVEINDIYRIHTTPLGVTADGSAQDVFGGSESRDWAKKIIDGIQRDVVRHRDRRLAALDYDPTRYTYVGLTASGDEDLITEILRLPAGSSALSDAEKLQNGLTWGTFESASNVSVNTNGVHLEPELLAFTASAFVEGAKAVQLSYGEPLLFLDCPPLLASGDAALNSSDANGYTYAVVDSSDTTAVMDVILIKSGPQVFRRDAKSWVIDEAMLTSLLSASPPPIVALTGQDLKSVLAQIDDATQQQLEPQADGSASVGKNLITEAPEKKPLAKPVSKSPAQKTPAKQSNAQNAAHREETEEGPDSKDSLTASLEAQMEKATRRRLDDIADLNKRYSADGGHLIPVIAATAAIDARYEHDIAKIRSSHLLAARDQKTVLEKREHELAKIIIPATTVVAAGSTPDQRKAEPLRKYWIRGVGAVKIKWGAPGDFRRCVRQLRKYLGSRTEGYCANRHHEATGMWPGDRRNQ